MLASQLLRLKQQLRLTEAPLWHHPRVNPPSPSSEVLPWPLRLSATGHCRSADAERSVLAHRLGSVQAASAELLPHRRRPRQGWRLGAAAVGNMQQGAAMAL